MIKTEKELLEFMSNNISYGYLDKYGNVHYPKDKDFNDVWYDLYVTEEYEDILKTKVGNCFDQTEFERHWFLKNGYEVKTFFEMVVLDYENIYPTHSFLTYKKNDKWYWFENADFNNRGIHEFESLSDLLDYQTSRYKKFLKEEYKIKDEEIEKIKLFEFDKLKKHPSTTEYINHAISGIDILNIHKYVYQDINNPKYLFHGSPKKLDVIEKRESHDSDGVIENIDNAVFLSSSFINSSAYSFKDTIKENSHDLHYDFLIDKNNIVFKNVRIPDNLEGYIYIFEYNNSFKNDPKGSVQYKSYNNLRAKEVLKVKYEDFEKYYKRR